MFAGIKPVKSASAPRKIENAWQGVEALNEERFAELLRAPHIPVERKMLPR